MTKSANEYANGVILAGIDDLLSADWGHHFTFDRHHAEKNGIIVLRWSATGCPIPLNVEISESASEKGRLNWREVHRKIKECLPENILKQRASEANFLLRGANRRNLRDVQKDFDVWLQKTSFNIEQMFGEDRAREFASKMQVPANLKAGSIQALQYSIEMKIDELRNM
jgi:hypothetical protein